MGCGAALHGVDGRQRRPESYLSPAVGRQHETVAVGDTGSLAPAYPPRSLARVDMEEGFVGGQEPVRTGRSEALRALYRKDVIDPYSTTDC